MKAGPRRTRAASRTFALTALLAWALGGPGPASAEGPGAADAPRSAPTWNAVWLAATLRDAAQHAHSVVAGEVVAVDAFPSGPQGQPGIHTRITLRTDAALLEDDGAPAGGDVEFWMPGGRLGNRLRVLTGQVRFEPGEIVAVLLYTNHGALWPASLGRAKWLVAGDRLSLPNTRGHLTRAQFRALVGAVRWIAP